MKIYPVKPTVKILNIVYALFIIVILISALIIMQRASPVLYILFGLFIIFLIFGTLTSNKYKVIIDNDKIEIARQPLLSRTGILYWGEIAELSSEYFLFPEIGFLNLIPESHSGRNALRIAIKGLPQELIKDIISHLSPSCKIFLYPYLKRKIEGKRTWFYKK